MEYIDFEDKNIVVVGGTNGMGLHLVHKLLELKANIIVLGRNINKPELNDIKGKCHFLACDISNSKEIDDTFDHIHDKFKTLHFAVNNAGVTALTVIFQNLILISGKKLLILI